MGVQDPSQHYIDEDDYKQIDPNPPVVYAGKGYDEIFQRNAAENARKKRNLLHGTLWVEKGKGRKRNKTENKG